MNNSLYHYEWHSTGINLHYRSHNNVIYNNTISGVKGWLESAIDISDCNNNFISRNIIENNDYGVDISGVNNTICLNTFINNGNNIILYEAINTKVYENNIFRKLNNVFVISSNGENNFWDGNYWNRPRLFPKFIKISFSNDVFEIDWHPALKPYDVGL